MIMIARPLRSHRHIPLSGPKRRIEVQLLDKPRIMQFPLLIRIGQTNLHAHYRQPRHPPTPPTPKIPGITVIITYLKPSQKARHKLINLHKTDIFSNTRPCPHAELEHRRLHLLALLLARLNPPFRPIHVDVLAKDLGPSMDHPGATSDNRAAGDMLAADIDASRGHDTFERETRGRVKAERFFDAGIEVGEGLGFGPRHYPRGTVFEISVTDSGVEFVHELLVASWVFQQVVEYCREAYAGGFGAGEGHADGHGENAAVVEEVGSVFFSFEEHGEEVTAADSDGLFGVAVVGLRSGDFGESLGHAGFGEGDDGEGEGHYAVSV